MEETLYQHLHKLSGTNSENAIEEILGILWETRKTGLSTQQKSHLQSLLNLPSLEQVDPVKSQIPFSLFLYLLIVLVCLVASKM